MLRFSTRNNCCEFLVFYGVITQSVIQSFLKTPVCGASLSHFRPPVKFILVLIVNHIGMCDFIINKTYSCSSGDRLSSLMHNLRVLLAFVNQLDCDKCPGLRTTKSSLQVPDFIAFEISSISRLCLSMGSDN